MPIPEINSEDFAYVLPPERIAQHPLPERDGSKLLVVRNGVIGQDLFRNLAAHLPAGSLLVFNNTRVIRARILFRKESGSLIEILCLEPLDHVGGVEEAFRQTGQVTWRCLIGHARRWKTGPLVKVVKGNRQPITLSARRKEQLGDGTFSVAFSWNTGCTFGELLELAGRIPLPPYITREDEPGDLVRYQTIYASEMGSVAAPTAGLHFTPALMESLARHSIPATQVTLHVGMGTFRPVTTSDISLHEMHREQFTVTGETLRQLLHHLPSPVIAVGTTSVRTLESLYWLGVRQLISGKPVPLEVSQWEPYQSQTPREIPPSDALVALIRRMEMDGASTIQSATSLMVVPGYRFRLVTGMITNFHQPRSTLLLLIAAFLGDQWKEGYRYALENGFRFLSYGDSCLFVNDQQSQHDFLSNGEN